MLQEGMIAILTGKKYCSHKKRQMLWRALSFLREAVSFMTACFEESEKALQIVVWKRIVNDSGKEEEKEQEWMKK